MECKQCGSYAINPHLHGRKEGVDLDLCDVCYWRKRAEVNGSKASMWQPIESAPKDGRIILLSGEKGPAWTGLWRGDVLKGKAGWTRFNCIDINWHPTHWMPLPGPPKPIEEE